MPTRAVATRIPLTVGCLLIAATLACLLIGGVPSSAAAIAASAAPKNTSLPRISGTAKQGKKLTASTGGWKNSPTSYKFQWRRCNSSGANCSNISSATSSAHTLVLADVGHTARVVVTAKNAHGSTAATSARFPAAGTVSGLPPANTKLPTISGMAKQGQKLTATNGSWNNSPSSY